MDVRSHDWRESFWAKQSNSYGPPNQTILQFAGDFYSPGMSAIDIAAGDGRYAVMLATLGYSTNALEYTASGVNRISSLAIEHGQVVNAFEGDFTALCVETSQKYDLVLSSGLLEEVDKKHHENIIKGYQAWTKPGGLNIIKYCLEISKRGQLVEDEYVKTVYDNKEWEILLYKENKIMKDSGASIAFNDDVDARIRTGTIIAKKR